MVAKTVFGSDGAASWQQFRNNTAELQRDSVAPGLQVKRADRLGTGLTTLQQERLHESAVRKQHGHAACECKKFEESGCPFVQTTHLICLFAVGSGYSNFQKKHDAEEAANRKKRKRIENRIRPDEKKYFILAEVFDGWKFDYVFTTRDRGTGYYWDGMDSLKKLRGELEEPESSAESQTTETDPEKKRKPQLPDKKTKKKKKKASKQPPVFVHNPNHPLEQVANAIRRRQAALNIPPSSNRLPAGWASAVDSTTGKTYFFNQGTGERQWDAPEIEGKYSAKSDLPEGWSEAKDKGSGKTYYYHTNGETRWARPTPHE